MTKEKLEAKESPLTPLFKTHIPSVNFCDYLDTKTLSSISQTSKDCNRFFKDELRSRMLIDYVVKGKEKLALKTINANPHLLKKKSTAQDYSGRTITGTAFQAALGAQDVILCKKILKILIKQYGKEEALKQFNEQFPNGLKYERKKDKKTVYNFDPLITAFINKKNVKKPFKEFWKSMTTNKDIRRGKHFNMQHLIAAYNALFSNRDRFENKQHQEQFAFYVISYIERLMPANDAQAYCTGLRDVAYRNRKPKRTLKSGPTAFFYSPKSAFQYVITAAFNTYKSSLVAPDKIDTFFSVLKDDFYELWARNYRLYLNKYLEQKQKYFNELERSLKDDHPVSNKNKECILL